MPVTGFVLTLPAERAARESLLEALARTPGLTLGAANGLRLPLVLESERADALDALLHELGLQCAQSVVELAFADFSDLPAEAGAAGEVGPRTWRRNHGPA